MRVTGISPDMIKAAKRAPFASDYKDDRDRRMRFSYLIHACPYCLKSVYLDPVKLSCGDFCSMACGVAFLIRYFPVHTSLLIKAWIKNRRENQDGAGI